MPTDPPDKAPTPLAGKLVLEIGARCGVAVAGSLFAQTGATVISVEAINRGDFPEPKWLHREVMAAGKLSLALDRAVKSDRELLERLVRASDIVLTSSDADPLAYGSGSLVDANACKVLGDLSAFGGTGPHA